MKRKKGKKQNWLLVFYNENKRYVWVVFCMVIVTGFSIGISIGKLVEEDQNVKYVASSNDKENENKIPESNDNEVISKNNDKIIPDNEIVKPKDDVKKPEVIIDNTSIDNNEDVLQVSSPNVETKKERKLEFILPVEGEIAREFTDNTLIYSITLDEWVSHLGIDILSSVATPVKAIEHGEITEIKSDPRYGYIVIVDHGQGYESIYCNLSTLDMVHVGKNVEKGQVISGVGNTALFEIKDDQHLHFEMKKDGVLVNPLEYIKKE